MTQQGILEKGSFGKKKIYWKYIPSAIKSSNNFIFFHGSFSSSLNNEKTEKVAQHITKNNIGSAYLYESSREVYTFESSVSHEEYKRVFGAKTIPQELDDIKTVYSHFLKTADVQDNNARIHLVGFSLGGTLCSYLLPKYGNRVSNVFLFGSGISTKVKGSTYAGYPEKREILDNWRNYRGGLHLIQGGEDNVIPKEEALEVFEAAKYSSPKNHIVMDGVDHSFRKMSGAIAIKRITDMIFETISSHLAVG